VQSDRLPNQIRHAPATPDASAEIARSIRAIDFQTDYRDGREGSAEVVQKARTKTRLFIKPRRRPRHLTTQTAEKW